MILFLEDASLYKHVLLVVLRLLFERLLHFFQNNCNSFTLINCHLYLIVALIEYFVVYRWCKPCINFINL